jgi:two-component system cell cycle response regulator DivK
MDKTILYIEDNFDNQLLIKRVLEAEGYDVLVANNGEEGISIATNDHPDLILIDINLPDIDGYEVTRRLRKTPSLTDTPILAVTANVMKGDREKTLAAGCNSYIRKPIDVDTLPSQVAAFL